MRTQVTPSALLVSVLAALSCSPGATGSKQPTTTAVAAAAPSTLPASMPFRWPVPSVVPVSESVTKSGHEAILRYDLHVCPAKQGVVVRYEGFHFESIDGQSADSPNMQAAADLANTLGKLLPAMLVDDQGHLIDTPGLEELVRATFQLKEAKGLGGAAEDPGVIAAIRAKGSEIWASWVGAWIPFVPNGPAKQSVAGSAGLPGYEIDRVGTVGNRVKLQIVRHRGTAELRGGMELLLAPLLTYIKDAAELRNILSKAEMQKDTSVQVMTDPRTLQPSESVRDETITFKLPNDAPKSRRETHRYRFDWEHGNGTPKCE